MSEKRLYIAPQEAGNGPKDDATADAAQEDTLSEKSQRPSKRVFRWYSLLFLVLAALLLYRPVITRGLPYLYDEDEAHHYNRIVRMVQTGDFNPHYFLKPSLHLYLRMPVVAASFLWEVRAGRARTLSDVKTKDEFGIGRYAFSTSHPVMLVWNRTFSLLLLVCAIVGIGWLLAVHPTFIPSGVVAASALSLLAPASFQNATTVGVDVLVTCMATLTAVVSVGACQTTYRQWLYGAALCAGLTVSSKYNAAPIVLLPLASCYAFRRNLFREVCVILVLCGVGFCIGTPYLFAELPLFLNHIAYEIWHYGIAGHEGHTAEPGLSQAAFYVKWLAFEGFGVLPLLMAVVGIVVTLIAGPFSFRVLALFPLTYFLFMCSQRANFTRNMLPLIPFLSLFATLALINLTARAPVFLRKLFFAATLLLLILQPAWQTLGQRASAQRFIDTRSKAIEWLLAETAREDEIAVEGHLQFPLTLRNSLRLVHLKEVAGLTPVHLFNEGFDYVITSSSPPQIELPLVNSFAGESEKQRVVENPLIQIWELPQEQFLSSALLSVPKSSLLPAFDGAAIDCASEAEGHCWLTKRISWLPLPPGRNSSLKITVMSPWPAQKIRLLEGPDFKWSTNYATLAEAGRWETLSFPLPTNSVNGVWIEVEEIHSPAVWGLNSDSRRLGLAVKTLVLEE